MVLLATWHLQLLTVKHHNHRPAQPASWRLTQLLAAVLYAAWALLPEHILHQLGITYYPSK
jgi:hypothetical protein